MADNADVVVIGAGAFGLSVALHCALRGRSVVVVERKTAGSQASRRAAGLFKTVQADRFRTALAQRSIDQVLRFEEWAGVPLDVTRSGSVLIGWELADRICAGDPSARLWPFAPDRFAQVSDDDLVRQGAWQYTHYYEPDA
jgi:choline dehydrogenase-like flavoprotein